MAKQSVTIRDGKIVSTTGMSKDYDKSVTSAPTSTSKTTSSSSSSKKSSSTPMSVTIGADGGIKSASGFSEGYTKQLLDSGKAASAKSKSSGTTQFPGTNAYVPELSQKYVAGVGYVNPKTTAYGGVKGDIPTNQTVTAPTTTQTVYQPSQQVAGQDVSDRYIQNLTKTLDLTETQSALNQYKELLAKQEANRMTYEKAQDLARKSIEAQYDKKIQDYLIQQDRANKARGFYGQAPADFDKIKGTLEYKAAQEAAINQEAQRLYELGLQSEDRQTKNLLTALELERQGQTDAVTASEKLMKRLEEIDNQEYEAIKQDFEQKKLELEYEIKQLELEGKTQDLSYKKLQEEKLKMDIDEAKIKNPLIRQQIRAAIEASIASKKRTEGLNQKDLREYSIKFNEMIDKKTIEWLKLQGYGVATRSASGATVIQKPITQEVYEATVPMILEKYKDINVEYDESQLD